MSIVLKTDPKDLAEILNCAWEREVHDALAMHATQMAIEEAKVYFAGQRDRDPNYVIDWINEHAAANLARLMGEGK